MADDPLEQKPTIEIPEPPKPDTLAKRIVAGLLTEKLELMDKGIIYAIVGCFIVQIFFIASKLIGGIIFVVWMAPLMFYLVKNRREIQGYKEKYRV